MIVSIHQPHLLPWIGYFNKVLNSDVFVWLDNVQFRKNYFQNRTAIKSISGNPIWLTLPVHYHFGDLISEIIVADKNWKSSIKNKIYTNYRSTPYYSKYDEVIFSTIDRIESGFLSEINYVLFQKLLVLLDIQTKIVKVAELNLQNKDPNGRLIEICKKLGANSYIGGKGGRGYIDEALFKKEKIEIFWQQFDPSNTPYSQIGEKFVPGLSIIDCLFNIGPKETKMLIIEAWNTSQN
jgi:hypothetical protein